MTLAYRPVGPLSVDPATHPRGLAFISAASGLVRIGDRCHVVADDAHELAIFDAVSPSLPARLVPLLDGDLPADASARKARKPDFESLVRLPPMPGRAGGALLALGSGSRPNRRVGALIGLDADGWVTGRAERIDLAPLYRTGAARFAEPNIEGAFVAGDALCLLQRGHARGPSASIRFELACVLAWLSGGGTAPGDAEVVEHDLGAIAGVPLAFTDGASLPDGRWVFSAVAERTDNAYDDGACLGAAIGVVGSDGRVQAVHQLQPTRKVEGIEARLVDGRIALGLVTDADDPDVAAEYGTALL
jgi:hypothetical protein